MRATAIVSAAYNDFFRSLTAAKQGVLMLDYDGTVAPFSRDRRHASPYPGISESLAEIMRTGGTRLIIVSGRSARDIPRLLGIQPPPEIWGSHGVELRLRSANKGEAVRHFLRDINPMTPVAYLGDDVDDEDAFRVLNGRGLTVLVKPKSRFTAAQIWLRPPAELVGFLIDWKLACRDKL